jgi:hypothetical protein
MESTCLGTFDVSRRTGITVDEKYVSLDEITHRSRHGRLDEPTAQAGMHHRDESWAAVRKRRAVNRILRRRSAPTDGHRCSSLGCTQCSGEGIGGYEDSHRKSR